MCAVSFVAYPWLHRRTSAPRIAVGGSVRPRTVLQVCVCVCVCARACVCSCNASNSSSSLRMVLPGNLVVPTPQHTNARICNRRAWLVERGRVSERKNACRDSWQEIHFRGLKSAGGFAQWLLDRSTCVDVCTCVCDCFCVCGMHTCTNKTHPNQHGCTHFVLMVAYIYTTGVQCRSVSRRTGSW